MESNSTFLVFAAANPWTAIALAGIFCGTVLLILKGLAHFLLNIDQTPPWWEKK